MRNQIDKIIITAMDRFVWFVLLVVMSHLVTEFTRVTGYARGSRNDVILLNDSFIQPMPVQNMLLYPGQDYGLYERPNPNYINSINNNNNNKMQSNAAIVAVPGGAASAANGDANGGGVFFSFRPLIDSIFEIPITTLRAVNNLVARLTGSYQNPAPPGATQKSVRGFQAASGSAKKPTMREVSA